jgi:methanesulfonate monooxygenase subunit beta
MIQNANNNRSRDPQEASIRDQIWDLVARSCIYLDRDAFTDYLALLDTGCKYAITAYSPDIRKDMTYLSLDKEELANLLSNIGNHIHLPGRFFRQAALYSVEAKNGYFDALSYVTVFHTNPDGVSSVFCVARYLDQVVLGSQGAILMARTVSMETRDIGAGCHYPI